MLRHALLLLFGLAVLVGCGKKAECFAPATLASFGSANDASDIPLDTTVPTDQQEIIKKDLALLGTLNLSANEKDSCTVGIKDFTGTSLVQWLKTRVRYIIGETFDYKNPKVVAQRDNSNPYVYSAMATNPSNLSEVVTVMTNIGSLLYLVGKQKSVAYQVTINNIPITVQSPRDGIIQIGKGMFSANQVPGSSRTSFVNSLLRLAVIMHEARHSDGHGNHAAFPHMTCDSGDYKGNAACEDNTNGPYAVQATMTRKFLEACTSCTSGEREGLLLLQADYESRLDAEALPRDDRPEGFWK